MKYFVLNVVHGLGPILRLLEVGYELNEELKRRDKEPLYFIIPDLGNKQNLVVQDEFIGSDLLQYVLVDPLYGELLKGIVYRGDDHRDFLRNLVAAQPPQQDKIGQHFESRFRVHKLDDTQTEVDVDPTDCYELARNPLVRLPIPGIAYTFGYRTDILREMKRLGVEGYDDSLLDRLIPILDRAEAARLIDFVQYPSTIPPMNRKNITYTPLHSRRKQPNTESIEPGIYVSVTGIEGLREQLVEQAKRLNLQLYCPNSAAKELSGVATVVKTDIVTNSNIQAVFSRFGWGAVTLALTAGKPLITLPASIRDDPEMLLNQKLLVDELGLASVLDERDVGEVLEEARQRANRIPDFLASLESRFGTIDGPKYTARMLADHLKN